jgi:hypothetical protein
MEGTMRRAFKFISGKDPLGSLHWTEVKERLEQLSLEYPNHVMQGDNLYPANVKVWAVSIGPDGSSFFASAKILGYSKSVQSYLDGKRLGKYMTGNDAVTALLKRGFYECTPEEYPEIDNDLSSWLKNMNANSRSKYRYLIHRRDIAAMCPNIWQNLKSFSKLSHHETRALSEMLVQNELRYIDT